MPQLHHAAASIRFFGDDLDPDRLSELLDCDPTRAWRKGDVRVWATGQTVRKTGAWLLEATDRAPGDFDAQIAEILADLPSDLALWANLTARFEADIYCGWFLQASSEFLLISPDTMRTIGERGLKLELCLYGPSGDDPRDAPHEP